jgi:hypothetical protein
MQPKNISSYNIVQIEWAYGQILFMILLKDGRWVLTPTCGDFPIEVNEPTIEEM